MADGDIDILRVPITIDPNGLPDTALVKIATTLFTTTLFDILTTELVRQPGLNTDKYVLVIVARAKA